MIQTNVGRAIKNIIGALTDYIRVPYSFGAATNTILAHLNTNYFHIHGQSFVYPDHADEVELTAGAGVWDLTGAKTEIIPVNTLGTSAFDLHWMEISSISAVGTIQLDIYKGSTKATRSTSQTRNGAARIQIPQQEKNERISCLLSDSTAGALTCLISFSGHYYA